MVCVKARTNKVCTKIKDEVWPKCKLDLEDAKRRASEADGELRGLKDLIKVERERTDFQLVRATSLEAQLNSKWPWYVWAAIGAATGAGGTALLVWQLK
jgi:hypothetical protein